jgi:transcriptional regulator with XRE-family HTH domain
MMPIVRRPEDIAAAVRQARLRRKWTQAQLAVRLKVNREWVSRLEGGEGGITLKLLLLALGELGLTLSLTEETPKSAATRGRGPLSIDEIVDE